MLTKVILLGIIGCVLGFLVVIYLCYKDWSVYLATFVGACIVIAFNTLPFVDSLVGDYVSGMFTAVKGFFFMILFGCIQSKIYTESGAAFTIADTVMNHLLLDNMSDTGKNIVAMTVILVIGTILNLGGIIAGVVVVLMYPITLVIFERCDIPKKFILGILGAGSYTFTLTIPGSPQVTNVAAMTALGTQADVALIPGLVGAAAEIVAIMVIMNFLINRSRRRGEHFQLHPLDPCYDNTGSKPGFIVSLIPMIVLFVLFNVWKLNINICLLCSIVLSLVLFWKQLRGEDLKSMLNSGAVDSVPMTMTVAAICGFAGVITGTEAFQSMIDAITGINIAPILICWVVVALMCMLTGGSSTGQLISLPIIAPKLQTLGLSTSTIHRVSAFAATTLDSMPYSGSILMLLPMCHMKLKEVYPALFVTTVIATTIGTAVVTLMCTFFPGLG